MTPPGPARIESMHRNALNTARLAEYSYIELFNCMNFESSEQHHIETTHCV